MMACLGHWDLIPELSHYDQGGPPEAGEYVITQADGNMVFSINWTKDGENHAISFAAPADGRVVPMQIPGVDGFHLGSERPGTLSSTAVYQGTTVAYAMRRVSGDGALMSVLQQNADGRGGWVRSVQIYRRR